MSDFLKAHLKPSGRAVGLLVQGRKTVLVLLPSCAVGFRTSLVKGNSLKLHGSAGKAGAQLWTELKGANMQPHWPPEGLQSGPLTMKSSSGEVCMFLHLGWILFFFCYSLPD